MVNTSIFANIVPIKAAVGNTVSIAVIVTNTSSVSRGIYLTSVCPLIPGISWNIGGNQGLQQVDAGSDAIFIGSFIMPSASAVLTLTAYIADVNGNLQADSTLQVTVPIIVAAEGYEFGTLWVNPPEVNLNNQVYIYLPIGNTGTITEDITCVIEVHEVGTIFGPGAQVGPAHTETVSVAPGQGTSFAFNWTALTLGGKWVVAKLYGPNGQLTAHTTPNNPQTFKQEFNVNTINPPATVTIGIPTATPVSPQQGVDLQLVTRIINTAGYAFTIDNVRIEVNDIPTNSTQITSDSGLRDLASGSYADVEFNLNTNNWPIGAKQVVITVTYQGNTLGVPRTFYNVFSVVANTSSVALNINPVDSITGATLLGVDITIDGTDLGVGNYGALVTPGSHAVVVSVTGYNTYSGSVQVPITGITYPIQMTAVGSTPPIGGNYKLINYNRYELSSNYNGDYAQVTAEYDLLPAWVFPPDWATNGIINAMSDSFAQKSVQMLGLRVFTDTSSLLVTHVRLIADVVPPANTTLSATQVNAQIIPLVIAIPLVLTFALVTAYVLNITVGFISVNLFHNYASGSSTPHPVLPPVQNTLSGFLDLSCNVPSAVIVIGPYTITPSAGIPVPPGTYTWSASAVGYTTQTGRQVITTGNTATLSITLVAGSSTVPPVAPKLENLTFNKITGINITSASGVAGIDIISPLPAVTEVAISAASPLTGLSTGDHVQVLCKAVNTGSSTVQFVLTIVLTKPDKTIVTVVDTPTSKTTHNSTVHFVDPTNVSFANNWAFLLDQVGDYTLAMTLTADGNTVDVFGPSVVIKGVAQGNQFSLASLSSLISLMMVMMLMQVMGDVGGSVTGGTPLSQTRTGRAAKGIAQAATTIIEIMPK